MTALSNIRKLRAAFHAGHSATQTPNGDESAVPHLAATFTKGVAHQPNGLVEPAAGVALVDALRNAEAGNSSDLDTLVLGTPAPGGRKFVNPKAGLGLDLVGRDPRQYAIPAAPKFGEKPILAEIAENYWMALLRDVPFRDYAAGEPLVDAAAADLTRIVGELVAALGSDAVTRMFRVPLDAGAVTPGLLFRGFAPTDPVGPWLSQFLLLPAPYGAQTIDQKMKTRVPEFDYMTTWEGWLAVQNGIRPPAGFFDPVRRYIRNGRDLSEFVHVDALYQAYFNACLILLGYQRPVATGGVAPAVSETNAYIPPQPAASTQEGFGTFGGGHILTLMAEVATRALKAVWFQKWMVHRRFRPEVFAARFEATRVGLLGGLPFDAAWPSLLGDVLDRHLAAHDNWLLPIAFPEGSPTHPAYGAGHATVAGACTTILKAWFDGDTKLAELIDPFTNRNLVPVVASRDGQALDPYTGADAADLTIGGELNKLAANISVGRNIAGMHWRSDHTASLRLGEQVAIATLEDYVCTFEETWPGFRFTSFDGEPIEIATNKCCEHLRHAAE